MNAEDATVIEPAAPATSAPGRLSVSGERARAAIAAELGRRKPLAVAHTALTLMAESALLDHDLREDASDEDLAKAVAAAVDGLEQRHPALFGTHGDVDPTVASAAAPRASRREAEPAARRAPRLTPRVRPPRPPITIAGWPLRDVLLAAGALVALVAIGFVLVSPAPARDPASRQGASSAGTGSAGATVDVASTGSVAEPAPQPLAGLPQIIGPVTLRLEGRTLRLLGVEEARGDGTALKDYLAGRPVACRPASGVASSGHPAPYECEVDGHDLAEVIVFNGGAKAGPDATPALVAAEDQARSQRLGIWRR